MATGTSQLNGGLKFDQNHWVVSLVDSQQQHDCCSLRGHAVILIEGLDEHGALFVKSFDAIKQNGHFISGFQKLCGNEQGTLELREFPGYGKKAWSTFEHRSRTIGAGKVLEMIGSIEAEIAANKQAIANGTVKTDPRFRFQNAGSERSSILGGNEGDNCVTWAEKWLIHVDAAFFDKAVDSVKATPRVHVNASTTKLVKRSLLTALGLTFLISRDS